WTIGRWSGRHVRYAGRGAGGRDLLAARLRAPAARAAGGRAAAGAAGGRVRSRVARAGGRVPRVRARLDHLDRRLPGTVGRPLPAIAGRAVGGPRAAAAAEIGR